jgi:hypothetical protein
MTDQPDIEAIALRLKEAAGTLTSTFPSAPLANDVLALIKAYEGAKRDLARTESVRQMMLDEWDIMRARLAEVEGERDAARADFELYRRNTEKPFLNKGDTP